jgi:ABC-type transport system substrate-binding protein
MHPEPWRSNRREALGALLGLVLLAAGCSSDSKSDGNSAPTIAAGGGATTSAGGSTATSGSTAGSGTAAGTTAAGGSTAPASTVAGGAPVEGGTLTAIHVSNPSTLDPIRGNSGNDHVSLYPFYDRLVTFDPSTLEPKPGLAESWDFSVPMVLTLKLKSGVKFHDGTDFNADAVKFNLERALTDAKTTVKADLSMIGTVESVSPTEVKINLTRQDTSLVLILADRPGMMVSPAAVAKSGDDYGRNPVGTGPFTFVEWVDNDHLTGAKNASYWQTGLPHLDKLTIRYIPDGQTGINSLLAGEADFSMKIDASNLDTLKQNSDIVTSSTPSLGFDACYLNYSKAPFNKVEVRQAINYAVDRAALNEAFMFGQAKPAVEVYPPGYWAFQDDLANAWPHDPDKAKDLLKQAGYADGLDIKGLTYDATSQTRKTEIIQAQLKAVGINMTFETMEVGAATSSFFENLSYDIYSAGWSGRPDPSQTANSLFAKAAFYNAGHVEAPGMEAALAAAGSSADQAERGKAFHEVVKIFQEQALGLVLLHQPDIDAYYKKVGGFVPNLYGKIDLSFLWIKK